MKRKVRSLLWLTVPALLAAGCSTGSHDSSVSYSPALSEPLTPTSDRPVARVYTTPESSAEVTARPAGATSQDWQLAEEIRGLLTADPKLGNAPMAAVVNNGVATLRGGVRNEKDRERPKQQIGA